MRKIAVANRKGGVAKTTTAVTLGYCLSQVGKKVLLLDTDAQANCSMLLGVQPDKGLADLLDGTPVNEVISEARPGLWLLAGSRDLAGVANQIARKDYGGERVLSEAMEPCEGLFDYILLDTSPGFSTLGVNALFYASEVLVPCSMESLAVDGLAAFVDELVQIRKYSDVELRYITPTFVDGRVRKSDEILGQLREHFGELVTFPIRYSVKLSEAPSWGRVIHEYAPRDRAGFDYSKLTGEIEKDG